MHEFAVTEEIIRMADDEAKKIGAKKITGIKLVIGDLSTFIDESVQMYFDILSKGTLAEGAELSFERICAQFKCNTCENIFNKPIKGFDCPSCGQIGSPTGVGKEFYIECIEVE
jgi:hydrogenase nickel incorporation protein HypA/HybF